MCNNKLQFLKSLIRKTCKTWWFRATLFSCFFLVETVKAENKPNVIFFLVDDMGWTDASCYGSEIFETPAIDKLASQGVRFTNAYASHPMCVASRYSLMTGKYHARNKKTKKYGTMSLNEYTIAEAMRDGGYKTFFTGKWHLGKKGAYPQNQGFDVNVGGHKMGAPASYFYPYGDTTNVRRVPGLQDGGSQGEYLTDRLTDETIDFIKKNKDDRFFVYLSHYAVHTPFEGKKDFVEEYKNKISKAGFSGPTHTKVRDADQKRFQDNPVYGAMIKSVDQSLNRIMKTLEELDLDENTIIVFTSDNGGDACKTRKRGRSTSNLPLTGGKCWLYEGGIRVPYIVKWKNHITPNVSDYSVCGVDHYPTILQLAGLDPQPQQHLDGSSVAPVLLGEKTEPRKPMFWYFKTGGFLQDVSGMEPGVVIRHGDFKLIEWYKSGTYELYNLMKDVGEHNDLSSTNPSKAQELLVQLQAWRQENNIK